MKPNYPHNSTESGHLPGTGKKVVVGLSGGVDSSVTAALLKQQGYEVFGVYMKNWDDLSPTLGQHTLEKDQYRMECPWFDEYLDAKKVALQLQIPFEMWDFREAYKQKVFDHFIDEFAKGRTPNPDIYCNSQVKFDDFLRRALDDRGVDYVATGHYARRVEHGGKVSLEIPADSHKDQTYFLYRLTQDQLAHVLFPLADYSKQQVRELAAQFKLSTQAKKDSQGICFIGNVDVRDFVAQWLAPKPGEARDLEGRVVGRHDGVHLHTIGEKIAVDNAAIARLYPEFKHAVPHFYVADKLIEDNVLVVVPGAEHPKLYKNGTKIENLHLIATDLDWSQPVQARLRHGGELIECRVEMAGSHTAKVVFKEPQRAITPGQHLVLYSNNKVLGGGVIS